MIRLFKITKTAWIAFFIALVATFVMASVSHAQSVDNPEEVAKKYNVTFPISELGGCQDYAACRTFCEDPLNSTTCINYAKSKGFYKEEQVDATKGEILEKAKQALGCDSYESCKTFCQISSNFEKCDSFAKQNNLAGGHVNNPEEKRILEKAKEILGCDSPATCASFCSDDANRAKCSEFAKETGLRGGERPVGPGGCTSEATCKAFCSDPQNYSVCSGFASSSGGKFQGPGGCNSEESCRSYCKDHESECRAFGGSGGGPRPEYDPQEMCNRTPNCSWSNNTCTCSSGGGGGGEEERKRAEEYAKICRENPARCTPGGVGGYERIEDRAEFEKYCSQNPEKCRPAYSSDRGMYDPAIECAKYAGCSWSNNSCQCGTRYTNDSGSSNPTGGSGSSGRGYSGDGNYGGNTIPSGGTTTSGGTGTTDPATGCRNAGGSWTGSYCQMPNSSGGSYTGGSSGYTNTQNEDPATACTRGGCSWTGSSCNCPSSTSSTPQPTSQLQQTSAPAPQPAPTQESQPAPQPVQESTPAPAPSATVQGISTVENFLQILLGWFQR